MSLRDLSEVKPIKAKPSTAPFLGSDSFNIGKGWIDTLVNEFDANELLSKPQESLSQQWLSSVLLSESAYRTKRSPVQKRGFFKHMPMRRELLLFCNDILRSRGCNLGGRLIDLPAFDDRISSRICGDDDEGLLIRKR